MKKILFVVYQPPCGTIWVNEAFRTAFGMYGEDIEPELLFVNEATISISQETGPAKLGMLSLKMVQKYIKKYETKVYAIKEDIEKFCINDIDTRFGAEFITNDQAAELIHTKDFVIFM